MMTNAADIKNGFTLPTAKSTQPLSIEMIANVERYAADLATRQCLIVNGDTELESSQAFQALVKAVDEEGSLDDVLVWQPLESWSGSDVLSLIEKLTDDLIDRLTAIACLARESE